MEPAIAPRASAQADRTVETLLASHSERYGFGSLTQIVRGWDPLFGKKEWWRVFQTLPRLRLALILAAVWNGFGRRPNRKGEAEPCSEKNPYFRHRSTFDLLTWEALWAVADEERRSFLRPLILEELQRVSQNSRFIPWKGEQMPVFSFYPARDHGLQSRSLSKLLFDSIDAGFPDNDSTALVLSSMLSMCEQLKIPFDAYYRSDHIEQFLEILEQHRYGSGQWGQKRLSYENGVQPHENGVTTWLLDPHNEVDPASNWNILGFLFELFRALPQCQDRIQALSRDIVRFLYRHCTTGDLLSPRMHMYYPLGPALFFLFRTEQSWQRLSIQEQRQMDPQSYFPQILAWVRAQGWKRLSRTPEASFDRRVAAPLLRKDLNHLSPPNTSSSSEAFHLLYPAKMICRIDSLERVAWLWIVKLQGRARPKIE